MKTIAPGSVVIHKHWKDGTTAVILHGPNKNRFDPNDESRYYAVKTSNGYETVWDADNLIVIATVVQAEKEPVDKTTKQLINELYHQRANLEHYLKDALCLIEKAHAYIGNDSENSVSDDGRPVTEDVILAWLGQFIDTHARNED